VLTIWCQWHTCE